LRAVLKTSPKPRRRRPKTAPPSDATSAPTPDEVQGLCGVAMLRIAMELKKRSSAPVEEVMRGVLSTMTLDGDTFRKYLAHQSGVVQKLEKMRRR
jgi:hypothetical protein